MPKRRWLLLAILPSAAAVALACADSSTKAAAPSPPPAPTAAAAADAGAAPPAARAPAAVKRLKGTLVGELGKAIAEKGAAGAVTVCGETAARVRDEVATADLKIGRTSSRLRNPGNRAPDWVGPLLAELEAAPKDARAPRTVPLKDGGLGYVEPLVTAPLCLQCHGPAVADDVKAAIATKYPDDRAVGFAEGDLRGVAWVEVRPAP